ncbi:hypothetical protein ACH5AL_02965 [Actinacidiphila glaucinigra]|uniref:hypothetical protein n=1 Tax=Actinacidiphila glaucinigra TaxID=235986 RepID=UPI0037B0DE45
MAHTSGSFPSAAAYADGVVGGTAAPFSWSDLESSAFARLPELHRAVAAAGADLDRTRTRRDHALSAGWLLLLFAPLALPLLAILAVKHEDSAVLLHSAVALICAGHIALRAMEWRRTRSGGTRATDQEAVLAAFETAFAAVSAGIYAVAATVTPSPGLWLLCAGQAAVAAMCVVSIRVTRQAAVRGVPTSQRPAFEDVLALVSGLDEHDRTALLADLHTALERLADAGVITAAQHDEAHRAPLGSLARRLWALERSPARQTR